MNCNIHGYLVNVTNQHDRQLLHNILRSYCSVVCLIMPLTQILDLIIILLVRKFYQGSW